MSDSTPVDLPAIKPPKSKAPLFGSIGVVAAVVIALLVYFVVRDDDNGGSGGRKKVVLGTVGASDPYWATFKAEAAKQGIDLEVKDFADYAQPNPALSEKELDVNQFQHIIYLANYNVQNNDNLVPVGATAIYPLGLYSKKYKSVDEIPAGATVAIPDDDSNLARGLLVLQSAGLVKLNGGGSPFSTLADLDKANSKVKVTTLKADLTPTSLPDVAAAIINNDFVKDAGLKASDAIAQDDPKDPPAIPYVNIFATRAENKDDPTIQKLVQIYQNSQAVLDGVQQTSGGTAVFVKTSQADLQKSLEQTEAQVKAAK